MFIKITVIFAAFLLIAGVGCQKNDFLDYFTKHTGEFTELLDKQMELGKSVTDLLEKKVELINQVSKTAESFGSLLNSFNDETD